uniref:Secreted protein n=1 Tax=Panagrellus redivivus TaxID=6233 RepID=A0A7E4VEX6_PANRE
MSSHARPRLSPAVRRVYTSSPLSLSLSSCLHTLVARLTLRALLTLARGTSAPGNSAFKLTKPLLAPATSANHPFCRISTSL